MSTPDGPPASRELGRILVIIPTYNEAENIEPIVARVRDAVPEAHVLVADDNSPDGTGDLADKLAANDDHVHVLHRTGKEGLGAAYIAGFRWGLERGYGVAGRAWTPTARTSPSSCLGCWTRSRDADLVLGLAVRQGRRGA